MMARRILLITSLALQIIISTSTKPSDYLLPPPQQHNRIPISQIRSPSGETPGFMQRIARWFGFGKGPKDQQVEASYQYQQYKDSPHAYHYHPPKAPCNLCNKVPWVPMFPGNLQYPLVRSHSDQPVPQNQFHPNSHSPHNQFVSLPTYSPSSNLPPPQYAPKFAFQPPLVQRAVKFNFPSYNGITNFNPDFSVSSNGFKNNQLVLPSQVAPIPIPNLSVTPIPPLYGPVPFNTNPNMPRRNVGPVHIEQVEASEVQTANPTQLPPTQPKIQNEESSFEIVKSVPVTEFVSSVEYPANIIQSQVIDINSESKPDITESDFPKLIELGSYEPITPTTSPNLQPNPIIVYNHNPEPDNYPEASSHNLTYSHEHFEDIKDYISSTTPPFHSFETTTYQTEASFQDILNINAQVEAARERIKNNPSHQTIPQNSEISSKRQRQTPKRLLDSPILYAQGNSPRPFTRDPSDLGVRSSTYNHNIWQSSPTPTPWVFAPTPTSTYSSIDASGQFAGISPPSQFQSAPIIYPRLTEKHPKQLHQIIIPYTSKNKPRPFKAREEVYDHAEDDKRYVNWSQSHEIDPHEQQESKLVTATEPPFKKTTKYLTKILASNIRELLKKEHDMSAKPKSAFDFSKLQKNIDEWTQQEFTSLTHKASTASLRGRSKNIPNEYLTTTPSLRQTTLTADSTEAPQITTHVESFLDEDEIKKYDFLAKLVEDNHIGASLITENVQGNTDQLNITTTTEAPISPFYIRTVTPTPASEPWEKLNLSISPLTKEKVYVVTPQASIQQKGTTDSVGTFKSPRFLVRPTPGSGLNQVSSSTSGSVTAGYTPELFGLMGLSAYIPSAPVETIDGHSKVITVITPSYNKKKLPENSSPPPIGESASAKVNNSASDITRQIFEN